MLNVEPYQRKFIPKDFKITTWEALEPYAKDLETRELDSLDAYQKFLDDTDELTRILSEDMAHRYIGMSCNTADKDIEASYHYFIENISPKTADLANTINKKMVSSPFADKVTDKGFDQAIKGIKTEIELFREESIPLYTEQQQVAAEFVKTIGGMTINLDGKEITMQQANNMLYETDRDKREKVWKAINERRYQDSEKLDQVFDNLVGIRHKIALEAGFENFRDYSFKSLKRFNYTAEDCYVFHDAIEKEVTPLIKEITAEKAKDLGLEKLRPWDGLVDQKGRQPIKAFKNTDDLIEKSMIMFNNVDPMFKDTLQLMADRKLLDLDTRMNKASNPYLYPLSETKIPFIFSNVTDSADDMLGLVHETGHAVHEIAKKDLRLSSYGDVPAEMAEVASQAMELMTMDQWHVFFPKEEDMVRAQKEQLERIIGGFPGIAQMDMFQHQVYLNPGLSMQERRKIWVEGQERYATGLIDWSGFNDYRETSWHRVMHIYELPFYYIEYAMAWIGALQVWRNYKQDKKQALSQYKHALSLGYTQSIPELYEAAGIKFDFSAAMLKDLMALVQKELRALS